MSSAVMEKPKLPQPGHVLDDPDAIPLQWVAALGCASFKVCHHLVSLCVSCSLDEAKGGNSKVTFRLPGPVAVSNSG